MKFVVVFALISAIVGISYAKTMGEVRDCFEDAAKKCMSDTCNSEIPPDKEKIKKCVTDFLDNAKENIEKCLKDADLSDLVKEPCFKLPTPPGLPPPPPGVKPPPPPYEKDEKFAIDFPKLESARKCMFTCMGGSKDTCTAGCTAEPDLNKLKKLKECKRAAGGLADLPGDIEKLKTCLKAAVAA